QRKRAANEAKIPPADPTELFFNANALRSVVKRLQTDRAQPRSTQKIFPQTKTGLPATKMGCERGENSSRGPNGDIFNANALRSVPKRMQRTERSCDRHKNPAGGPNRHARNAQ